TLAHTIAVADVQVRAVFAPVFQHHSQAPLHRQPIWLTALFLEGRLGTLQHSGHLGKRPLSHPGQSPEHLLRHSFPSLHLHDGPPLTGEVWNHSWDGEGILKMRLCKRSSAGTFNQRISHPDIHETAVCLYRNRYHHSAFPAW